MEARPHRQGMVAELIAQLEATPYWLQAPPLPPVAQVSLGSTVLRALRGWLHCAISSGSAHHLARIATSWLTSLDGGWAERPPGWRPLLVAARCISRSREDM